MRGGLLGFPESALKSRSLALNSAFLSVCPRPSLPPPLSYILDPGPQPPSGAATLRPVPASKSDIFKDRSLSLSEKRSLMGFLAAAMEAAAATAAPQGAGSNGVAAAEPVGVAVGGAAPGGVVAGGAATGGALKAALSGGGGSGIPVPLVEVLRAQGVPPHLRRVVLHGIAMCDYAQEGEGQAAAGPAQTEGEGEGSAGRVGTSQMETPTLPRLLSASDGVAALRLLAESTSRFGGPGAFMVPSWGCGSLPEAFVRCGGVGEVGRKGQPRRLHGAVVGLWLAARGIRQVRGCGVSGGSGA